MGTSPAIGKPFLVLWSILLALELEVLLVSNYEIRTELRTLFGLPLYHIFLSFVALAGLSLWTNSGKSTLNGASRSSRFWVLVHIGIYGLIYSKVGFLWSASRIWSKLLSICLWSILAVFLISTWLLAWLPVRAWKPAFKSQSNWLVWVLPLSLIAPYMAEYASSWWSEFAATTFRLSQTCLYLFYDEVTSDPERRIVGTNAFVIEILPGCSGYEGMGLIATLTGAYLWLRREALLFPRALLLWPLSILLAYLANIVRLVTLILIGSELSPSIALRGFHSQAGWISFTVLGFLTVFWAEYSGHFVRAQKHPVEQFEYPALPYLAPMVGLLLATMLVEGTRGVFPYSYPVKPVLGFCFLLYFAPKYQHLWRKPDWEAYAVGIGVYLLWVSLAVPSEVVSPFVAMSKPWTHLWLLSRVVGGVVVVPVCEELAFRGYLFRRVQCADFESSGKPTFVAYLFNALSFGVLHTEFVAGALAGTAYAWLSTRRAGLTNSIVAHSFTNGLLAAQVLLRGDWWLW